VKKKKKGARKEKEKDQSQITIASHDAVASVHFKTRDEMLPILLSINLHLPDRILQRAAASGRAETHA